MESQKEIKPLCVTLSDRGQNRRLAKASLDFLDVFPKSKIQEILPLLKSHFEGEDLSLTATLLQLTAEICKSGELMCFSCIACMQAWSHVGGVWPKIGYTTKG